MSGGEERSEAKFTTCVNSEDKERREKKEKGNMMRL
jgi:hypothetical protein